MLDYETFAKLFRHNLGIRSRTSKGKSDTSSSPDKPQLIGDENSRIALVAANMEHLIELAWPEPQVPPLMVSTATLQEWNDRANVGLVDVPERDKRVGGFVQANPDVSDFNPGLRTWETKYGHVTPLEIVSKLEEYQGFIRELCAGTSAMRVDLPTLLGAADYLLDGYVHPWADGCGRTTLTLVMYMAAAWSKRNNVHILPRYESYGSIYFESFDTPQPLSATIALYRSILVEV